MPTKVTPNTFLSFRFWAFTIALADVSTGLWLMVAVATAWGGTRWWLVFILNAVAVHSIWAVPMWGLVAWRARRRWLAVGLLLQSGIWVYAFGGLFMPPSVVPPSHAPTLTIMTYNMLAFSADTEAVIAVLRESHADVIAIQELNPAVAEVIQRKLSEPYPYQILRPQASVAGMGMLSRYPMLEVTDKWSLDFWVGRPIVVDIEWENATVHVVNVHASPGVTQLVEREAQALMLAQQAQVWQRPALIVGDFNATDTTEIYAQFTGNGWGDAWRAAGWGAGGTWPGADKQTTPGSARPQLFGVSLPQWLMRIDYIFYSSHWRVVRADLGAWDGVSDHRPVVAELLLNP